MEGFPAPDQRGPLSAAGRVFCPRERRRLWKAGMDGNGPERLNESLIGLVKRRLTRPTIPSRCMAAPIAMLGAREPVEIGRMEQRVLDRGLGKARGGRFLPPRRTDPPARIPGLIHRDGAPPR